MLDLDRSAQALLQGAERYRASGSSGEQHNNDFGAARIPGAV
jgi:hypothetical protein